MAKSLISWAVLGVVTYGWYWVGYAWQYLQNIPRGSWEGAWVLFTLLVILIQRRNGIAAVGGNVIESMMSRIKTVIPHVLGLVVALMVGVTVFSLHMGGFIVNEYVQGVIIVISNSLLVSMTMGAFDDATQ